MSALKPETPVLDAARAAIAGCRPVVIYGPSCRGKSHNREVLREALGAHGVLDGWDPYEDDLRRAFLHLSGPITPDTRNLLKDHRSAFLANFDHVAVELGLEIWTQKKQAAKNSATGDVLVGQLPNLPSGDVRVSDPDPKPSALELLAKLAVPPSDLESLRGELRRALVARFRADLAAADFVGACELLAAISAQDDEDLERVKLALADWLPEGPA